MARGPIDFYFDFSSPYSYIASEWIEALAARHGRTVTWKAILLGATFQAAELKSPVAHPIKREYSLRDFERSARFAGVPLAMPEKFPIATQNAARVFWWLDVARRSACRGLGAHAACAPTSRAACDLSDPVALRRARAEFGLAPRPGRSSLERPAVEAAPEAGQRCGDRRRRLRRAVLRRRRRAVLGQRPPGADRALAREGAVLMKKTAKSLVDEAMVQVTTYTVEQARALHGHPGVQFVDVRDVRELEREGVIPGAVHAPRGMLEFWVDPESPYHRDVFAQDKEYVLFCAARLALGAGDQDADGHGAGARRACRRRLHGVEGSRRAGGRQAGKAAARAAPSFRPRACATAARAVP